MLDAVNAERAKVGLPQLCYNKKLNAAAQAHSEDQARYKQMTHTGSDGSSLGQRVTAQNFVWSNVGENVAAGQRDVASVMEGWMNSPGHRANILNKEFKFFGMGYSTGGETPYWTQNFGNGASEECDNGSRIDSAYTSSPMPAASTAAPKPVTQTPAQTSAPATPCPSSPAPTEAPTPAPSQAKPLSRCPVN
ncbi:hypothetical protein P43SY_001301 [Pythium insidiosum]|uniref:SCP domain-containing protein n=1 Tax=Pythium insidiosum TaxID=114742 RepID=A0AAD5LL14_PYTIN|nr:hypothetical protein P43SY_001301 [Pythium insidiosum]